MSDSPAPDPVAAYLSEVGERAARLLPLNRKPSLLAEEVAQDVPRLLTAAERVLKLHSEFRIYDECGHEHTQDEVDAGTARDTTEFVTCEDGYIYSVCRACCTGGWSQTEACASDHERPCWPCGTVEAISAALLGKETGDA